MPVMQDARQEITTAATEPLPRATKAAEGIVLVARLRGARRRPARMQRLDHGSWLVTL